MGWGAIDDGRGIRAGWLGGQSQVVRGWGEPEAGALTGGQNIFLVPLAGGTSASKKWEGLPRARFWEGETFVFVHIYQTSVRQTKITNLWQNVCSLSIWNPLEDRDGIDKRQDSEVFFYRTSNEWANRNFSHREKPLILSSCQPHPSAQNCSFSFLVFLCGFFLSLSSFLP